MLIPDMIRKTVAFIGIKESGEFKPCATGFFVAVFEAMSQFIYLVTADHVVAALHGNQQEIWLRVNRKDGGVEEEPIPSGAWLFWEDGQPTDVVAVPVAPSVDHDVHAICIQGYGVNPDDRPSIADDDVISSKNIGVGEEVSIVGLFRTHYGKNRNIPIVRIGSIAAMPEEPIKTREYGYIDAYLVEAHSVGGLSGSPVFVNMAAYRIVRGCIQQSTDTQFWLLGLMHGHFDIPHMNLDVAPDEHKKSTQINSGIGVVVPVSKILKLLTTKERIASRVDAILKQPRTPA